MLKVSKCLKIHYILDSSFCLMKSLRKKIYKLFINTCKVKWFQVSFTCEANPVAFMSFSLLKCKQSFNKHLLMMAQRPVGINKFIFYPTPLPQAGCNSKLIFKQGYIVDLNLEFSFYKAIVLMNLKFL